MPGTTVAGRRTGISDLLLCTKVDQGGNEGRRVIALLDEGAKPISGHQNGNCRGWHNCLCWSAPDLTLTFQTASQRPQGEGRWLSIRGDLPISSAPVLQKEGTLYGELRSDVHFRLSNRLSIASNWFLLAQCVLCAFSRASARGSESSPDVGVGPHDSFNRGSAPHSPSV